MYIRTPLQPVVSCIDRVLYPDLTPPFLRGCVLPQGSATTTFFPGMLSRIAPFSNFQVLSGGGPRVARRLQVDAPLAFYGFLPSCLDTNG